MNTVFDGANAFSVQETIDTRYITDVISGIYYPLDATDIMDNGMTAMDVTGAGTPLPVSSLSMGKYIRHNTIDLSRCIWIGSV